MDLDEVAHYEPHHQDLLCLQILLFSYVVLKELRNRKYSLQYQGSHLNLKMSK